MTPFAQDTACLSEYSLHMVTTALPEGDPDYQYATLKVGLSSGRVRR
jgi:hypothetical protein